MYVHKLVMLCFNLILILDCSGEKLGINTYGISVTTLEEVFLKVGEGDDLKATEAAERQSTIKKMSTMRQSLEPIESDAPTKDDDAQVCFFGQFFFFVLGRF